MVELYYGAVDITAGVQSRITWREGSIITWNGASLPTQDIQIDSKLAADLTIGDRVTVVRDGVQAAVLVITDFQDTGTVTKMKIGTVLADYMDRLAAVSLTGVAPAVAAGQVLGEFASVYALNLTAAKQIALDELCNVYALYVDGVKKLDVLTRLANLGSAELMVGPDGLVWWSDGDVVDTTQGIEIASRLEQAPQARTARISGYSVDYAFSGDVPATAGTDPMWSGDFGIRNAVQASNAQAAQSFGLRRVLRANRKRYKATVTTDQFLALDEWYLYDGKLIRLSALTHQGTGFAEAEFEGADL